MITHHVAAAAKCAGTWQQRWNCGMKQPTSSAMSAGYDFGHTWLPVLVVLFLVLFVARAAKKRKKSRSASPAGAGR